MFEDFVVPGPFLWRCVLGANDSTAKVNKICARWSDYDVCRSDIIVDNAMRSHGMRELEQVMWDEVRGERVQNSQRHPVDVLKDDPADRRGQTRLRFEGMRRDSGTITSRGETPLIFGQVRIGSYFSIESILGGRDGVSLSMRDRLSEESSLTSHMRRNPSSSCAGSENLGSFSAPFTSSLSRTTPENGPSLINTLSKSSLIFLDAMSRQRARATPSRPGTKVSPRGSAVLVYIAAAEELEHGLCGDTGC